MQVRCLDFMFMAALAVVGFAAAAQDVRGAKDHPLASEAFVRLLGNDCTIRSGPMDGLDGLLTVMTAMELIGVAFLVGWFVVVVRSGLPERLNEKFREFVDRHRRR